MNNVTFGWWWLIDQVFQHKETFNGIWRSLGNPGGSKHYYYCATHFTGVQNYYKCILWGATLHV
jgi:hypothetical protein